MSPLKNSPSFQFEGSEGDKLIEVGATFTKRQKFTIAELKERRHRDHKLEAFLSDNERHKECRRQGLQGRCSAVLS